MPMKTRRREPPPPQTRWQGAHDLARAAAQAPRQHAHIAVQCSIHDIPFAVQFRSRADGTFVIARIIERIDTAESDGAPLSAIPNNKTDWSGFRCPWCKTGAATATVVKCWTCNRLMCAGGQKSTAQGLFFQCACGDYNKISGVIESFDAATQAFQYALLDFHGRSPEIGNRGNVSASSPKSLPSPGAAGLLPPRSRR
jgi:hypothetical protein